MGIVLSSLSVHGFDREIAEVTFAPKRQLIRGPSETGKSHIFDALWYTLGGGELPTTFPLMQGYQEYRLRFTSGQWGLDDIENISLDDETCDLRINDRARLSFGAGIRGLYLSALMVAFMEHALTEGLPHLGLVVLDSPLKAYADPKSTEVRDIPIATVNECFYKWLSEWSGKGQVIVLENEDVLPETAEVLKPIAFTRVKTEGRYGFYPLRNEVKAEPPPANDTASGGHNDGE